MLDGAREYAGRGLHLAHAGDGSSYVDFIEEMQIAGSELQHFLHIMPVSACVRLCQAKRGRAWEASTHGEHGMQACMHARTLQKAAQPA